MALRNAYSPCLLAVWLAACGGAVFGHDEGQGGSGNTGATSSYGGSTSTSGKPGKGGSSSSAGAVSMGGSVSTAGSVGTAGSVASAGSVGTAGAPNCTAVDCAEPVCADGGTPVTPPGQCCPTCPPPQMGCESVKCQPVMGCGMGYTLERPPGACCEGCVPNPGGVACPKIACPQIACPLGYVRGDLVGGCCTDCVPDRLFCNSDGQCVIADRPRPCCGCPEVITTREYQADQCWSAVDKPRMSPPECQPPFICDAICGACPPPGVAHCVEHRCLEMPAN